MVLGISKGDNLNGDYVPVTSRLFKTYLAYSNAAIA